MSKNRVGNPNFDIVNLLGETQECDRRTDRQHKTDADKYNAAHTLYGKPNYAEYAIKYIK